jgi:hypothetical protein
MTGALVCLAAVALIGLALWAANRKSDTAARNAALRVETAKSVQRQRAREDAAGVAEAAAQDKPRRKHRKKA